jgi:hypothetical protein
MAKIYLWHGITGARPGKNWEIKRKNDRDILQEVIRPAQNT